MTSSPTRSRSTTLAPLSWPHRILWLLYEGLWALFLTGWTLWRIARKNPGVEIAQRFGHLPKRPAWARQSIWIHAVSVGEVISIKPVIEEIKREHPGAWVLLTTSNEAAYQMAERQSTGADALCRTPWDSVVIIRRSLRRARPDVVAIVECELWPNLMRQSAHFGARVHMINARIYAKDFANYRRARLLFRPVFDAITSIHTQSQGDLDRFRALGVPDAKLFEGGNTKFDAIRPAATFDRLGRAELGLADGPIWVWASTHEDEEARLLNAMTSLWHKHPDLQLIIAPRDITRAAKLEELFRARGRAVVRRTALPTPSPRVDVLLLDTLGELNRVFPLADVVFVGGSLVAKGGHNPIEPAAWAKPIVMGPHVFNFADIVAEFRHQHGLRQVANEYELIEQIDSLLSCEQERLRLGRANERVLEKHRGSAHHYAMLLLQVEARAQAA